MVIALLILAAVIGLQSFMLFRCQRNVELAGLSVLERVQSSPDLELRPVFVAPKPTTEKPYVTDHQYDDERWNELVGAPGDVE